MKNRNIKILHIISHNGIGGAQSIVRDLILQDINQYVYSLRMTEINQFAGVPERNFSFTSKKMYKFHLPILQDILRLQHRYNFRILHIHLGKPLIYAIFLKIFKPKIKIVYHEHGRAVGNDQTQEGKSHAYQWYLWLLQIFIDFFIAVSNFVASTLSDTYHIKKSKIHILHNFVDLKNFTHPEKSLRQSLNKFNTKTQIVGFAGRLIKRKGWYELLRAAGILIKRKRPIHFLIAGTGLDSIHIQKYIDDHNLSSYVTLLGNINNMEAFYRTLDCFVIPSHWEPMGITELEAQACGIPVIASNIPGLNEVITHKNGLLVDPKDYKALANAIERLLNDLVLRRTIIANASKTVQQYSLHVYLKKLYSIYEYTNA